MRAAMKSREPRVNSGETDSERVKRLRLLRCFWAVARAAGMDEGRAYQIASGAVGRMLVRDFGLTTCTKVELIRCVDAVKREAGQVPGRHRSGRQGQRQGQPNRRTAEPPNVIRIASLEALQLLRALVEELRLSVDECAGIFRKACGAAHPRTAVQVGKCIEAVKAIRQRRVNANRQDAESAKA